MDGSLSHHPGVVVLVGDLDAAAYSTVREALAVALANDDGAEIVVDLRSVRFMDAGTIRLLLEASQIAVDAGRRLWVTGARDPVRQVIVASGAGQQLFDSADRALFADHLRATAQRQQAQLDQARILGRLQQQAVDSEIRTSRRRILSDLRTRLPTDPHALCSEDFLAVADTPTVLDAIILTAVIVGAADACDLQLHDAKTATLQIVRQRGFTRAFLTYFALVDAGQPTSCAVAATTGEPVIVDDVASSPIFAGQPSLDVVLAAGTRAVHSHPLHDDAGRLLAVLSLHYRTPRPRFGNGELVAWCAARALSRTVHR